MLIQVILLLLGAIPNIISPLITSLEESIEFAEIKELIKSENTIALKSLFKAHSEILKSSATKSYKNEAFELAVRQGRTSVVALFLNEIDIDPASLF